MARWHWCATGIVAALLLLPGSGWASERAPAGTGPARTGPAEPDLRELSPADRRIFTRGIAIADRTEAVREQRERYAGLRPTTFTPEEPCCISVWYAAGGKDRAVVKVDLRTGAVLEQWTGHQVEWEMARGYEHAFGDAFNSPWVLIPLGLLFLAPFVDPRRPFRLLHLDLLVLLGFGVSHVLFNRGEIGVSVPLVYPVLAYLLVRMLVAGWRPRPARDPLVPFAPARWLLGGAAALFAVRAALNIVDSTTVDVGYASIVGADHLMSGGGLYDGSLGEAFDGGDTYGPVNYLAYVPFVAVFGWSGEFDELPAAHAAAIAFDAAVGVLLFVTGRRLRAGAEGVALGAALSFAWMAYPYSLFTLMTNSNDALVGALVLGAVAALGSAPARGVIAAAGAAAKFAPLAIAPLLFNPRGEDGLRGPLVFAGALAVALLVLFVPFVPSDGISDAYDRTLGFQLHRESPFSIWGQDPSLDWAQTVIQIAAVNLAVLLLVVPARKDVVTASALAAAVLIALQLAAVHWFYLYVAWFAPVVLVALFARHERVLSRA